MGITLSGHQLKFLLEMTAPDMDSDSDQLETEISIEYFEDGHSGSGLYFYYSELPEEGCMKLPNTMGEFEDEN